MVQEVQRRCRGGAGAVQVVQGGVQGRCRWCRMGAGYLHLSKHNIRSVQGGQVHAGQGVQAHLRFILVAQ